MATPSSAEDVLILDGGMGRELQARGAPFRQPEWSALALMEAPEQVAYAHAAFVHAGADVIITNSYALVPYHIGEARFTKDGAALAALSGALARAAASAVTTRRVLVAASLPPTCGSYAPAAFTPAQAARVLGVLVPALSPHADVWLAETLGAVAEARAADAALRAAGVRGDGRPLWLSFTLRSMGDAAGDAAKGVAEQPLLLSGESVADAVAAALELGASALLFNCAPPEVMRAAVAAARAAIEPLCGTEASSAAAPRLRLGVYANAFAQEPSPEAPANAAVLPLRPELTPAAYASFAVQWRAEGASILGGCCGVGPTHIAALAAAVRDTRDA